jgi:hypothetical protein
VLALGQGEGLRMDSVSQFLQLFKQVWQPRVPIKINLLLRGGEKEAGLDQILAMKWLAELGKQSGEEKGANLATVPEETIRDVEARYGKTGLFQLMGLAMSTSPSEFKHFFDQISSLLNCRRVFGVQEGPELACDNDRLRADPKLAQFPFNMVQPSLSRKLYRAGVHPGSLVYGLGGPRILISHPFRGVFEDTYDVYMNALDVVTTLNMRGIEGTFHLLDLMPGLDDKVKGVPAWLVWFGIIAAHSDLVIFIKEHEGDFGPSQKLEMGITPDTVQKKIIEIPHGELKWAKKAEVEANLPRMYVGKDGLMTKDAWGQMEAEHAMPFVKLYAESNFPRDRWIRIDEAKQIEAYTLDSPVYDFEDAA